MSAYHGMLSGAQVIAAKDVSEAAHYLQRRMIQFKRSVLLIIICA